VCCVSCIAIAAALPNKRLEQAGASKRIVDDEGTTGGKRVADGCAYLRADS
jgi:hypothetical protein